MKHNQQHYEALRQRYPLFVYDSYRYYADAEGLHLAFRFFNDEDLVFEPTAFIPQRSFYKHTLSVPQLDALVFNLGMVELVSYWKACCSPRVEIRCGALSRQQIDFWKKLYFNGLGEFFYVNDITTTLTDFMTLCPTGNADAEPLLASSKETPTPPFASGTELQYLVPIGGGKDSVVTLEVLQRHGCDVRPLIMNPRGATTQCAAVAGFSMDDVAVIHRTIHPKLLQLNAAGFLNGHTPFSAMLAFYTLLVSALTGISNVALSNEASANEATVAGTDVNHQYSKSVAFENDFRHYVQCSLQPTFCQPLRYFSFLRPLSELEIAKLFAELPAYHDVFRSCNVGSKDDCWCGHCPKCLFAYIILSPFLPPARLEQIFGHNLLDDTTLQHEFDQLTGRAETKPFECVGTVSEVLSALSMTRRRWYSAEGATLPYLLTTLPLSAPTTSLTDMSSLHNLNETEYRWLQQALLEGLTH